MTTEAFWLLCFVMGPSSNLVAGKFLNIPKQKRADLLFSARRGESEHCSFPQRLDTLFPILALTALSSCIRFSMLQQQAHESQGKEDFSVSIGQENKQTCLRCQRKVCVWGGWRAPARNRESANATNPELASVEQFVSYLVVHVCGFSCDFYSPPPIPCRLQICGLVQLFLAPTCAFCMSD